MRTSDFLTHPVFQLYHAETEMLRYLRWLAAKDVSLDRSMIPLGSCTMKLNATTEMIPVTWRQFSAMHPFAPLDQTQGYQQLVEELEEMLCEVTGFEAIPSSPTPVPRASIPGLLAIRKYHESRGEGHRDICLIPASAHGTNPASAQSGGPARGRRRLRCRAGQRRHGRPQGQGARARGSSRRPHDHLSLDPRRLRGGLRRDLPG